MAIQIASQPDDRDSRRSWRHQLPTLQGERVVLRQLRPSDAAPLFATMTTADVARFISAPPPSVAAFERFIEKTAEKQADGRLACFAVTRSGHGDSPIGLFQVRELEPSFRTAEWGFAIGSPFWGTGLFEEAASLVLAFAFDTLGAHRMEARAAVKNGRGNRAIQKIGGVPEGVLRQAFLCEGEYVDQIVYGIVDSEWRAARRGVARPRLQLVH